MFITHFAANILEVDTLFKFYKTTVAEKLTKLSCGCLSVVTSLYVSASDMFTQVNIQIQACFCIEIVQANCAKVNVTANIQIKQILITMSQQEISGAAIIS